MQAVQEVEALAGQGLKGDRYATGEGSYSKATVGRRQVTLMNARFFPETEGSFPFIESRRNILVEGVDLMDLIGKEFQVGGATFKGVKYCDPCSVPSNLAGKPEPSFKKLFQDCGGLIAEIVTGGMIRVGDSVVPPPKEWD